MEKIKVNFNGSKDRVEFSTEEFEMFESPSVVMTTEWSRLRNIGLYADGIPFDIFVNLPPKGSKLYNLKYEECFKLGRLNIFYSIENKRLEYSITMENVPVNFYIGGVLSRIDKMVEVIKDFIQDSKKN